MSNFIQILQTLLISLVGVAIFWILNLPLPFLLGPLFASLIAALAGVKLRGTGIIAVGARTILGVAVGASITPAVITQLPVMFASVALVPIYIALIAIAGIWYFNKICKFDKATSYFAAMPGGLQDMILFGQEAGGDTRALSLIHATRVLIIVSIAPIILIFSFDANLDIRIGNSATEIPIIEQLIMIIAALVGWYGGVKIKLFGASILGPMIVTGILSIIGVIHFRPPAEAILFAQFFIGTGIGVSYVDITVKELRKYVSSGIVYVLILTIIAFGFTEFVKFLKLANPLDAFLAFWPGGQAEMTILAILTGADLGYIIVHHLSRLVLVISGAPLFAKFYGIQLRGK